MKKAKEGLTIADVLETKKPLVRDFIDPDKEIERFISIRLPHVPHCTPQLKLVYQSKDKHLYKYRVNWWLHQNHEGSYVTTSSIVTSKYYEITKQVDGIAMREL